MFAGISWTDYLAVVTIGLSTYYLIVGLRYYSAELKELISGKIKVGFSKRIADYSFNEGDQPALAPFDHRLQPVESTNDNAFSEIEELIGHLKDAIETASIKKYIIQELRQSLRMILKKYPNIKNSPFRSSINELLVSECEKCGTVAFSEEEADKLWLDTV